MSKKTWLLSASFAALVTPTVAFAQDAPAPTTPSGTEDAAVQNAGQGDDNNIVVTATGRRQILQDVPLAVTAVGGEALQNSGRHRHPPAQPARPVAARLLDRHRGQRLGPYPRHRHGRRQSRPRKLGRGLRRRRLPLAQRHRPQRARRGRADRGAARPAGHLVRPQRLGRPDPRHHPPARIRFRRLGRALLRQLQLHSRPARHHRPDLRAARLPGRRHLHAPRRLLRRRQRRRAAPNRTSTTATASSPAANCCSSPTTLCRSA